jgi:hypothetical protein
LVFIAWNHGPVADLCSNAGGIELAVAVSTKVWIAIFAINTTVVDDVLEGTK